MFPVANSKAWIAQSLGTITCLYAECDLKSGHFNLTFNTMLNASRSVAAGIEAVKMLEALDGRSLPVPCLHAVLILYFGGFLVSSTTYSDLGEEGPKPLATLL